MIVRPRLGFREIFIFRHETVLGEIWRPLLGFGLWAALVVVIHDTLPRVLRGHAPGPYALIGVALSVFFSFRNNACYERWWEGRCQWGHLILSVRNFARQTLILETGAGEERRHLLRLTVAFCYALVSHLRPSFALAASDRFLTPEEVDALRTAPNRPNAILQRIGQSLAALRAAGTVSDIGFQLLDHSVQQFGTTLGACERIRSSPVPFSYHQLLQRTTFLFLLVLPFGFLGILGWADILAEVIIAYVFLGLDVLGDELERPFGDRPNNLPLAALAQIIEIDLRAAMGETDLPPMPKAVDCVLM
ncbi:bestrophin family protein [Acidisoma sp. 7E03]